MTNHTGEQVLKMRALAARLRVQATETGLENFRRKFEAAAAELEQRAREAETPFSFRLAG